jgi:serine/threonine protein kinase
MKAAVGQYTVLERLGRGALGDVFRARDSRAGRTVALVVPAPELMASPTRRAYFLEAARRAATLNHPNIAMLFDVVVDDDRCYLAYEFAAGPSLRDEMGGAALPARQALHLAAQIADALAEGHDRGIVHGDLRPDTIVVTPKGSVKVLNFGLTSWTAGGVARAKAAAAPDAIAGDEAQVAGYLSPEQVLGAPVDPRSDLFAFGVVLYEMLTGRQPFAATTPGATLTNVLGRAAPRPSAVDRCLPEELDQVVARLLAKTPDGRYQMASAAAIDIRRLAVDLDSRLDETAREAPPPRRNQRSLTPWIALFAGLTLAAAIWHYLRP